MSTNRSFFVRHQQQYEQKIIQIIWKFNCSAPSALCRSWTSLVRRYGNGNTHGESWIINCAAVELSEKCQTGIKWLWRGRHMTTILNNSGALQHFETFSTPWREGGGALKQQRKVNGMHRVHNLHFVFSARYTKSWTCNYAARWRVDFRFIQMLMQSSTARKKCREKPRFWNKSRTRLAHK